MLLYNSIKTFKYFEIRSFILLAFRTILGRCKKEFKFPFFLIAHIVTLNGCENKVINRNNLIEYSINAKSGVVCGDIEIPNKRRGNIGIFVRLDSLLYFNVSLKNNLTLIDSGTITFNYDILKNSEIISKNAVVDLSEYKIFSSIQIDSSQITASTYPLKYFLFPCSDIGHGGEVKNIECVKCDVKIFVKTLGFGKRIYQLETDDSCKFKNRFLGKIKSLEILFEDGLRAD